VNRGRLDQIAVQKGNIAFAKRHLLVILHAMSTVQEIEAAIPRLSRSELEQFHTWFEDYMEAQLELTDEVKTKLDESRREIAAGNFTTRQPQ
jgi:hypothetical protein